MPDIYTPLEERFLNRCDQSEECWLWTGGLTTNGYGQLLKKVWGAGYAHQWACHHWNDSPLPVPKGYCIKHSCDTRHCVNPAHLSFGTVQENIEEMVERNPNAMGRKAPTQEQVALLRKLLKDKIPRRELARQIGRSRHWINRIARDYL